MPKPAKSQWDFSGELFPAEQTRKVLTVIELTSQVRRLLEQHIGTVWVTGEITNFRLQSSGHIYFTLKDALAQLNCVLFRGDAVEGRMALGEGQKVVLRGELTVYEVRGQYQLRVTAIELQGIGALQVAFEKLKQKLQAEGLFAQERKRALPGFPQRIGLITSPTAAAIRDVLHVIERRNPSLEIIFAPCNVQGQSACYEIAASIRLLNEFAARNSKRPIDLLLLTRGGGSLEDLWAFNEEVVARAIFNSRIPVVSAVGHEIDFTISDFVADFRAATPSAAAEIITEGVFSKCNFVVEAGNWLKQRVYQRLDRELRTLRQLSQRIGRSHPRRRLNDRLQLVDELQLSLRRCAKHDLQKHRQSWQIFQDRLSRLRPARLLEQRREVLLQERLRLHENIKHQLQKIKTRLSSVEERLRLLSPQQVLARGYSITTDSHTGRVIRAAEEVTPGQKLRTRVNRGEIKSTVTRE